MFELDENEYIVTAWAEDYPQYKNHLVNVLIHQSGTNKYRIEAFQPKEQSEDMKTLFCVCDAARLSMTNAVKRMIGAKR